MLPGHQTTVTAGGEQPQAQAPSATPAAIAAAAPSPAASVPAAAPSTFSSAPMPASSPEPDYNALMDELDGCSQGTAPPHPTTRAVAAQLQVEGVRLAWPEAEHEATAAKAAAVATAAAASAIDLDGLSQPSVVSQQAQQGAAQPHAPSAAEGSCAQPLPPQPPQREPAAPAAVASLAVPSPQTATGTDRQLAHAVSQPMSPLASSSLGPPVLSRSIVLPPRSSMTFSSLPRSQAPPVLRGSNSAPRGPITETDPRIQRMLDDKRAEQDELERQATQKRLKERRGSGPSSTPSLGLLQTDRTGEAAAAAAVNPQAARNSTMPMAAEAAPGLAAAATSGQSVSSTPSIEQPQPRHITSEATLADILAAAASAPHSPPPPELAPPPPSDPCDIDAWAAIWRAFLEYGSGIDDAPPLQFLLQQFLKQLVFVHDQLVNHLEELTRARIRQAQERLPRHCSQAQREQAMRAAEQITEQDVQDTIGNKCPLQLNSQVHTSLYRIMRVSRPLVRYLCYPPQPCFEDAWDRDRCKTLSDEGAVSRLEERLPFDSPLGTKFPHILFQNEDPLDPKVINKRMDAAIKNQVKQKEQDERNEKIRVIRDRRQVQCEQALRAAVTQLLRDHIQPYLNMCALETGPLEHIRPLLIHYTMHKNKRMRVLLRLLPSDIDVRARHSVVPANAYQWIAFSGVVVGMRKVERFSIEAHRDTIQARSQREVKERQDCFVQDLPVQQVFVHLEPLDDAFVSRRDPHLHRDSERLLRRAGVALIPDAMPTVVEVHGEQAGSFAMGDRVVGYGWLRPRSSQRDPNDRRPQEQDDESEEVADDDEEFMWLIQANNMLRINSREWIVPRCDYERIFQYRCFFRSTIVQMLGEMAANHQANGAQVADWLLTSMMVDFAFNRSCHPKLLTLLKLQLLLSLVSGGAPISFVDRNTSLDRAPEATTIEGLNFPAFDRQPHHCEPPDTSMELESDAEPVSMLVMSGKSIVQMVRRVVEEAASNAVDLNGCETALHLDSVQHEGGLAGPRDMCNEFSLMHIRHQYPLEDKDEAILRGQLFNVLPPQQQQLQTSQQSASVRGGATSRGRGGAAAARGRGRSAAESAHLAFSLSSIEREIPTERDRISRPPKMWLHTALSTNPRPHVTSSRYQGGDDPKFTTAEVKSMAHFDLVAYYNEDLDKKGLTDYTEHMLFQHVDRGQMDPKAPFLLSEFEPELNGKVAERDPQQDPSYSATEHAKRLHQLFNDELEFKRYIALAQQIPVRMWEGPTSMLKAHIMAAIDQARGTSDPRLTYNAKYASLARRLAIAHARLHLREEVSLLDMGVAIMICDENIAQVHGVMSCASRSFNRWSLKAGMLGINHYYSKPTGASHAAVVVGSFQRWYQQTAQKARKAEADSLERSGGGGSSVGASPRDTPASMQSAAPYQSAPYQPHQQWAHSPAPQPGSGQPGYRGAR